ncbi:precorrin-2 dehydrogenase/sirohydrochlorin ferrochelatase family protein [Methanobacterium aggregans]|uniref:precorrin-2 dehydrogenase/sirohydrochlorin ferrochelatase family protein n=1 Tax=Methanobacterium aggregans TaxID=1615586 RepID=UPI001AE129A6|nr:bifunctional precorrin-2 dehydrogenase/sirohydrochlorin ferrochelatase [Methanobacterium aggregans]MBP2045780.1 precorrin-2 dehydrogenase/sirohydrochlorin ferrochelatase [Methanobacterium aggregans]
MGWTPLFLEMHHKNVLVVGAGEVGERRARRFLEAGASVVVLGSIAPREILELGASLEPMEDAAKWVEWADLVVTATPDTDLNQMIADLAGIKLVNRADAPQNGNFIVPSSFFIGDVQICIFTGGKSPLMSKELRKKIQKVIKTEDVLQLELQDFARNILKKRVDDQKARKKYLYQILNDEKVKKFLEDEDLQGAQVYVECLLSGLKEN